MSYSHEVQHRDYLNMLSCKLVKKAVAVILFKGKPVHTTQPYASEKGADISGKKLAARYQAYWKRTGRRWDEEQREIRERKQQTRKVEMAAKARVRNCGPELLKTVEDFIIDHDNGLGPHIDRLRAVVINIREGI